MELPEHKATAHHDPFESRCGLSLAIFAAILAINELGSGKFGDDEILGANEKASTYAWYQAKSIKEGLAEGQRNLLDALMKADAIAPGSRNAISATQGALEKERQRYESEKSEILAKGKAWETKLDILGRAGDRYDLATLFLQLSLVLGAISLVMQNDRIRRRFYAGLVSLGLVGAVFSVLAYVLAFTA